MSRIKIDNLIQMIESGEDLNKMPTHFVKDKLISAEYLLNSLGSLSDEEKVILQCFKDDLKDIILKRKEDYPRISG